MTASDNPREGYNPVEVERAIRSIANTIAQLVTVCGDTYKTFLTADREYDLAFATHYLRATGPVAEKKYRAEVRTTLQRQVRDDADAAYKLAERRARAAEAELRALQSIGASVRQGYGVAGRGEF